MITAAIFVDTCATSRASCRDAVDLGLRSFFLLSLGHILHLLAGLSLLARLAVMKRDVAVSAMTVSTSATFEDVPIVVVVDLARAAGC